MKINYIPGLALSFYPGLTRNSEVVTKDAYYAENSRIAIFTGTAPSEDEIWAMGSLDDFITSNQSNLVYEETTQLEFKYDSYKQHRIIQRYPINSIEIEVLCDSLAQDQTSIDAGTAIKTNNSLYAVVYCPDIDTSLNTVGNDLLLVISNVGTNATDFMAVSTTEFLTGDTITLRNMTISINQGYQITDTPITENIDGQDVIVDTEKSFYINKVWGNRISEAYRKCFVPDKRFAPNAPTTADNFTDSWQAQECVAVTSNATGIYITNSQYKYSYWYLRAYDFTNNVWTNNIIGPSNVGTNVILPKAFLVNDAVIQLIDQINALSLQGNLPRHAWTSLFISPNESVPKINAITEERPEYFTRLVGSGMSATPEMNDEAEEFLTSVLYKYIMFQSWNNETIKLTLEKYLTDILSLDASLVSRALKCIIPLEVDHTTYQTNLDYNSGIYTIQNNTPLKLRTKYKQTLQNPTNEQLYIFIPRILNRNPINKADAQRSNSSGAYGIDNVTTWYASTQDVIDGNTVDNNTLNRKRLIDYTAISIGLTGNGQTDLEYDTISEIDYIDSLTAMLKIPNKF